MIRFLERLHTCLEPKNVTIFDNICPQSQQYWSVKFHIRPDINQKLPNWRTFTAKNLNLSPDRCQGICMAGLIQFLARSSFLFRFAGNHLNLGDLPRSSGLFAPTIWVICPNSQSMSADYTNKDLNGANIFFAIIIYNFQYVISMQRLSVRIKTWFF